MLLNRCLLLIFLVLKRAVSQSVVGLPPNPRIDWLACGQSAPSFICDPDGMVDNRADADRLAEIVQDAQLILKGKATCRQRAADPQLYVVFLNQTRDTNATRMAHRIRDNYATSVVTPTACDLTMLLIFVYEQLSMDFIYSSDIQIPRARSRNFIQNSHTLLVNLAEQEYIVLLAEATNIVNQLLQPLETDYWLMPNPMTNPRDCRQERPNHVCDPEGVFSAEVMSVLRNLVESSQDRLYTRSPMCEETTHYSPYDAQHAELFVVFLSDFPTATTRNISELAHSVRELYSWRQENRPCDATIVLLYLTKLKLMAVSLSDTTGLRTFSPKTALFPANSRTNALNFTSARLELNRGDYARSIENAIETLSRVSRAMRLEDERMRREAAARRSGTVWYIVLAVAIVFVLLAIFLGLYFCLVRGS